MALSSANVQTLIDSITKAILDLETAFGTTLSSTATAFATNQATLLTRLSNIGDIPTELGLGAQLQVDSAGVTASVTKNNNAVYALYAPSLNLLDLQVGGLNAYLTANSIVVHSEFANAFSFMIGQRIRSGITAISAANTFSPSEVSLGTIAVTGASAGTFTGGSTLNTANFAPVPLFLKNIAQVATPGSAPTLAAATATVANPSSLAAGTYTVGYTFITAAGETALSPTATQTITAGQYINVSSISFPTGATGIKFYVSIAAGNSTVGYCGETLSAAAAVGIGSYGNASLSAPVSNSAALASVGTATSFTVTYTNAAGTSGQTSTQALSGALAANGYLAINSISGSAVSNIVVNSGGSNGDSFAVVARVLRAVAY